MTNKAFIAIDAANLMATLKACGKVIDYRKLLDHFNKAHPDGCRVVYYTAVHVDPETGFNDVKKILDFLSYNGILVRQKPARIISTKNGPIIKGNMDIEIAVDMIQASAWANEFYLFSGDGDFSYLTNLLRERGKMVTAISASKISDRLHPDARVGGTYNAIADILRQSVDWYIDINDPKNNPEFFPYLGTATNRDTF